jgi:hypothetical protein
MADIERLYSLSAPYDELDIEEKHRALMDKLLSAENTDRALKKKVLQFLKSARKFLLYYAEGSEEDVPPPRRVSTEMKTLEAATPYERFLGRSAELIVPPRPEFTATQENPFALGQLNPLHKPYIQKCLLIDTRFRDNFYTTTCSNFTFSMPYTLKKVVSMKLSAFEFPVSFYGISSALGNNYLNISITYNDTTDTSISTTASLILSIADGNYNASDLIEYINALLQAESTYTMFMYVEFALDLTTNSSGSGKTTVYTTGDYADYITNIKLDFTLDASGNDDSTTALSTKLGWALGFLNGTYDGDTSYSGETLPEPGSVRYIYLVIDDFQNNTNDYFISALGRLSLINKNIIARIPIKGSYFSLMMENDLSQYTVAREYFGPVDITRLKIQILDDHGRVLSMNNSNYSICLNFNMLYE